MGRTVYVFLTIVHNNSNINNSKVRPEIWEDIEGQMGHYITLILYILIVTR